MVPKEPVYADLHHSTNPPAPPLSVEPVQYAAVREQTDNMLPNINVSLFYVSNSNILISCVLVSEPSKSTDVCRSLSLYKPSSRCSTIRTRTSTIC